MCIVDSQFLHNANEVTSFVDRDMYMRFRGGGVGHVPTRIEDDDVPVTDSTMDVEIDAEVVTAAVTTAGALEGEDGNGDDDDDDAEGRETDEDDEGDEDETEDDGGNEDIEPDDIEGLGPEQIVTRLREVIIDDLGYSDL